ncbi:MAG: DUF445 domain-containing protein [Actinomycetota bacterium]|nr:DUF445 domain-containing protein [Actinomycetota bacterium]
MSGGAISLSASPGDEGRARDLRRMKLIATGFFGAAAVVFVVAKIFEDDGSWIGYVRAGSEAAMVGALADWFAVTALFRHPLGLPIPHTAIIPNRKNEIGRSLGEFVQGNFLTREVITERMAGVHVGERLGSWLSEPNNAERAAEAAADAMGGVLEVLDDRDVEEALGSAVERRLEQTEVAPLLGKAIDVAVDGNHHQRMLDGVMKGIGGFLEDNREMLRDRLDHESPWWVPDSIDDRVFAKIFGGVQRFLADVSSSPNHEVRTSINERVVALAAKLRNDPALIAKCEAMKLELLHHPDVQAWLQSLWGELKASMLAASKDPESELRCRLVDGFTNAGVRLTTDREIQAKIDDWVERLVSYVVENYKHEVAGLISSTVERWDSADTSKRIELQVGRDLQFIRINGTVVGGLAGIVIHTVSEVFF